MTSCSWAGQFVFLCFLALGLNYVPPNPQSDQGASKLAALLCIYRSQRYQGHTVCLVPSIVQSRYLLGDIK